MSVYLREIVTFKFIIVISEEKTASQNYFRSRLFKKLQHIYLRQQLKIILPSAGLIRLMAV